MPPFYQTDLLTTLAYLMGERTVNSSTSASRSDFIQSAVHDVYGAYPWPFNRTHTTLTVASGIATLPVDYDVRHYSRTYFTNDDNSQGTLLDPVADTDDYQLTNGDRAMWVEAIPGASGLRYQLRTKDTDLSSLRFRYQTIEPVLSTASTGTPYPNKRTLALGARTYVKLGQNPDADISQEAKLFEAELAKDIAQFQVQAPRRRRRTAQGQTGNYTGSF